MTPGSRTATGGAAVADNRSQIRLGQLFQMVHRNRAEPGAERGRAARRELLGVELQSEAEAAGVQEQPLRFVERERLGLAEHVDEFGQFAAAISTCSSSSSSR